MLENNGDHPGYRDIAAPSFEVSASTKVHMEKTDAFGGALFYRPGGKSQALIEAHPYGGWQHGDQLFGFQQSDGHVFQNVRDGSFGTEVLKLSSMKTSAEEKDGQWIGKLESKADRMYHSVVNASGATTRCPACRLTGPTFALQKT